MADDLLTLAEMVTINDQNVADIDVSDIFDDAPLLRVLQTITASNGTEHKYLKQTGAPVVGFRAANAGRGHDVSVDALVSLSLSILDATHKVDKDLADAYQKGGPAAWLARESRRHLRAAFKAAETQIVRGTANDADGFSGLVDTLSALANAMVLGNGGTTGTLSSVYMVRTTADDANVDVVLGQDGNISIAETIVQLISDGTNDYPGYVTPISGWLGLQVGNAKSIGRLANIDDGSNKLDDDALSNLYELFPEEAPPTHIAMNKRSRRQLQQSRTATGPTGAPAPWPTEWEGVPIISTSAIQNGETAVA